MYRMHEVTRSLEVSLGPDTGDLSMRMGIHSGPVTAGVLRGERSRFQLFGDTGTLSYLEDIAIVLLDISLNASHHPRVHVMQSTPPQGWNPLERKAASTFHKKLQMKSV
jgi:Adenylate and Guanylate cyclase catalytic domain